MNCKKQNIIQNAFSIYDTLPNEWIYSLDELQALLDEEFLNTTLPDLPLRTRSKKIKEDVCHALGYKILKSFKKTQPRFLGQNLDIYTQKSNNLQIWNEAIDLNRRYAIIHINKNNIIDRIKIILGSDLIKYDTTGTLTTKYQATMHHFKKSQLFSISDTKKVAKQTGLPNLSIFSPIDPPKAGSLLPIDELFKRIKILEGQSFKNLDALQDRKRGDIVHKEVLKALGYTKFADNGKYPDVLHQLLEIKTQTSQTIDLGHHTPTDSKSASILSESKYFSPCDVRYAIIDSHLTNNNAHITVDKIYLVNGADFNSHFPLFGGKVKNAKLQLPLPSDFFK